jgi:alpha-1,3-rhamnosyl/mannosyltransferase
MAVAGKWPALMNALQNLKLGCTAGSLKKYPGYLYHSPSLYLPPGPGLKVATVHDLSTEALPEAHPAYRRRLAAAALGHLRRRADYLLTDSEFSRREIIERLSWPPELVRAVPLAASGLFRPRTAEDLAPILAGLGLRPQGYSLFVGTVEPRKNIGLLLEAYEGLPENLRRAFPLVIAGAPGWLSQGILRRLTGLSGRNWLHYLNYCPAEKIPFLMAGAALFLYPSLYEGFGLPPLEAMSCGVPVLVSDRASLPEVVGEAAPCLPALEATVWREAIWRGLEDAEWREAAARAGLSRAAQFSWDRCAAETLAAYEEAARLCGFLSDHNF